MVLPGLAPSLVAVAAIGCSSEPPPPPVAVGPEQGFEGNVRPLHAGADVLHVSYVPTVPGSQQGIHKVSLGDGGSEQLAIGAVRHTRITDGALVAVMTDDLWDGGNTRLVTIPLDGSAVIEVGIQDATRATAFADGITYAIERYDNAAKRTRIVTMNEPINVVLETTESYGNDQLVVDDRYLYWVSGARNHLRVAKDGSEDEPTYLWESRDWDSLVLEGQIEHQDDWMLGIVGGEAFAVRNYTSFVQTGTSSNGDPRGYDTFGGGALYTVGPGSDADSIHSADARLVRGDVRGAWLQDGAILAQLRDNQIVDVDLVTGATTPVAETVHDLDGNTRLVRTETAIFYDAGYERGRQIHVIDLSGRN